MWTIHTEARLAHVASSWTHVTRRRHPCRTAGARHVRVMSGVLNSFAVADFGHSPNTSAPQSRILIAISPAVHGSLDQTSLTAKARIQLGQSPSDGVTLCLIDQTVSTVLVLAATCSRIDAVLSLEFLAQSIHVDRLNVASNGVLHLDAVARVLESNPLDSVVVLANNQWGGCWNWTWSSIWIYTSASTAWSVALLLHLRTIARMLWRTKRSWSSVDLWYMRLHLSSRTVHALLRMLI